MRTVVAERKAIRPGDVVRIAVALRGDMERSRVSVWAAEDGFEFSPYVPPMIAEVTEKGRPSFVSPYYCLLHEKRRTHSFTLTADVPMTVRLMHEIDTLADPKPKVRIKVDGKIAQVLKWHCRNLVRRLRGLYQTA